MKRIHIILILTAALPFRELHRLFSNKYHPDIFPLDPEYVTSNAWHVHFIVTKLFMLTTVLLWALRERGKDRILSKYLGVFTVFYTLDFVLYLLNHSQAGSWYLCVYIPVLVYGIYITKRK